MASKSEFTKSVARGRAALCLALCMLGLSLSATARDDRKPTIITYDIPGAGTGSGQRTIGGGIIPNGAILGEYVDANNVYHGFVRARDGNITTFDVAGAEGTNASGINPAGAIPGVYFDSNGVNHGYVRTKQGAITTFDVPAAGTGAFQGTLPERINPSGAITGQYLDASGVNHGFLRDKHGVITTFDSGRGHRRRPGHLSDDEQPVGRDHRILHGRELRVSRVPEDSVSESGRKSRRPRERRSALPYPLPFILCPSIPLGRDRTAAAKWSAGNSRRR